MKYSILAIVLALLGCLDSHGTEPASDRYLLRVRAPGEPLTLDWNLALSSVDGGIIGNLMDGLVRISRDGKLQPALAASWSFSEDGRTVTFQLRKDVRWSDGEPLRARQFVDSWKRLLTWNKDSFYSYLLYEIDGAREGNPKVKALADDRLEVRLASKSDSWIWNLALWPTFPIRKDLIDKHGDPGWTRPGNLVTLGAFVLEAVHENRNLVLARNPAYFDKRGNVEKVVVGFIPSEQVAQNLFRDGKLDIIPKVSPGEVLAAIPKDVLRGRAFPRVYHLDFNHKLAPSSDHSFRKAVAMAIDRSRCAEASSNGLEPSYSIVPHGFIGYAPAPFLKTDQAAARESLKRVDPSHLPSTLNLATLDTQDFIDIARCVREQLKKELGITVSVKHFPTKALKSALSSSGDFHFWLLGASAKNPESDYFYSIYLGDSGNDETGWKDAAYDQKVSDARAAARKTKAALLDQANRMLLYTSVVTVPLFSEKIYSLVRTGIKGFEVNPFRFFYLGDVSKN